MQVSEKLLEELYLKFKTFVEGKDGLEFKDFKSSKYIQKEEGYKYAVFTEAQEKLGQKFWKPSDIGLGKIKNAVHSAIQTKVYFDFQMVANNLLDWRKKDDFKYRGESRNLEQTLFNFYKNKISDQQAFEELESEKLSYQFIAYLFFLKDNKKYLPIAQQKFDRIIEILGITDFKTLNNISWSNYLSFIGIIKQVKEFLKIKYNDITLLDAHSFLWILGNQMIDPEVKINSTLKKKAGLISKTESVQLTETAHSTVTKLSVSQWQEIILNKTVTLEEDIQLFIAIYQQKDHEAAASEVAIELGTSHPTLNLQVARYAKRIAEHYEIHFTPRSEEKDKYYDLFFNGRSVGDNFIWQLKEEIVEALLNAELVSEHIYPDELELNTNETYLEGFQKTVLVNFFERNRDARKRCIDHWKAICQVCSIDFEKTYGTIGAGFIHVHHLKPISSIREEYKIDPIKDLIPVCPNCHAMLHRRPEPYSVEELRDILKSNNDNFKMP